MTNLEWIIKGSYIEAYDGPKGCKLIINCESGKLKELSNTNQWDVTKWLLKEHKEKIKLKKWEYDLLGSFGLKDQIEYIATCVPLLLMVKQGHFKGVKYSPITIKEILDNCDIVPDDYFEE